MLAHAGMLEASDLSIDMARIQQEPEKAWEEWKEHEGKHRFVGPPPATRTSVGVLTDSGTDSHIPGSSWTKR